MNGGAGLFGPGIPLDRVSPGMVIDVASLILQVTTVLFLLIPTYLQVIQNLEKTQPSGLPCSAS